MARSKNKTFPNSEPKMEKLLDLIERNKKGIDPNDYKQIQIQLRLFRFQVINDLRENALRTIEDMQSIASGETRKAYTKYGED